MANSQVENVLLEVDPSQQSYVQKRQKMDADPTDEHLSRNRAEHGRTQRWHGERSSDDRRYIPRTDYRSSYDRRYESGDYRSNYDRRYGSGDYRSNYDRRYEPRDYRSSYDRQYLARECRSTNSDRRYVTTDYRSNNDRRYESRDYRSSYDRQYLTRTHYRYSYHRKYYPPGATEGHVVTNLNRWDEYQYNGRGNYVRENRRQSPHFGVSTENPAEYHAEQEERRKMERWRSKRSSSDIQYKPGISCGDIFPNQDYLDAYHGQESYSKQKKVHGPVEHFGFSSQEVSRISLGNNVESIAASSSHLVENEKESFGLYEYGHPALVPAVNDASIGKSYVQFSQKKPAFVKRVWPREVKYLFDELKRCHLAATCDKVSHGSEHPVERSSFCEQNAIVETLAHNSSQVENSSSDVGSAKNSSLAVLTKKDNVLDVSQPLLEKALVAYPRRKLLVLDVNGLLADIVFDPPKDCAADTCIARRAIFKRPFCSDFLKFCFERFDVGIWSSRSRKIIDRVVDYLLGDMKDKLLFCWDLSYCTGSGFKTLDNKHKELVFKELRKIWEKHDENLPCEKGHYNESNTLLLDDSPYKALLNPIHSAIFPNSFSFKDKDSDNSLGPEGDLRLYLQDLAAADNVRKYVELHPFGQKAIDETNSSWEFYHKVITSLSVVP